MGILSQVARRTGNSDSFGDAASTGVNKRCCMVIAMMLRNVTPEGMKQAYIVVTTVPIILVYPFVQRFFIKGVLIGSIKE